LTLGGRELVSEHLPPHRQITVAEIIRYLRVRKNLSARSVSLQAGLSSSYVGKLEAGAIEPSFTAFARLALVLEMNPQEVFFCVLQENMLTTSPPRDF
jgi:transcriptional regulator with XRE-family HTH domain